MGATELRVTLNRSNLKSPNRGTSLIVNLKEKLK